ncbi:DUF192 domain-containing protein [Paraglaciecola sp. MB-3u-78]|jgi:uncharacterized membrane protein (UPF0127 family)|uniref:DUF192 domain-containing protein n=1 Tax=Paraglaciecola sp. MB-3u-78 TaxID=2058332 RepID=UPI000C3372E6|nr:DUF192 domain-containing protein [Paraglaciecola sp. MB-3u-78]PKG96086.1 hypothetical protein CXF95_24325 [Paraglaciecola sp. MB-3u-78]
MPKLRLPSVILILAFISSLTFANQADKEFPQIQVEVKQQVYPLEYANTFELRAQGLMHRENMCENCGMLFNFQQNKTAGMWMKNTLIPLDVAFIRQDGKITDIKAMQPHDLTNIGSSERVLYAWEMNQGWFAKNAIKVGDTVVIPLNHKP